MLIYDNITDRQTDKHIKSIDTNFTKKESKLHKYNNKKKAN